MRLGAFMALMLVTTLAIGQVAEPDEVHPIVAAQNRVEELEDLRGRGVSRLAVGLAVTLLGLSATTLTEPGAPIRVLTLGVAASGGAVAVGAAVGIGAASNRLREARRELAYMTMQDRKQVMGSLDWTVLLRLNASTAVQTINEFAEMWYSEPGAEQSVFDALTDVHFRAMGLHVEFPELEPVAMTEYPLHTVGVQPHQELNLHWDLLLSMEVPEAVEILDSVSVLRQYTADYRSTVEPLEPETAFFIDLFQRYETQKLRHESMEASSAETE